MPRIDHRATLPPLSAASSRQRQLISMPSSLPGLIGETFRSGKGAGGPPAITVPSLAADPQAWPRTANASATRAMDVPRSEMARADLMPAIAR